jgi:hypothetical protein
MSWMSCLQPAGNSAAAEFWKTGFGKVAGRKSFWLAEFSETGFRNSAAGKNRLLQQPRLALP